MAEHGINISMFKFIQPKKNEDGELLKAALESEKPSFITFNKGIPPRIKKLMTEIIRSEKGKEVDIYYFHSELELATEAQIEGIKPIKGMIEFKKVSSGKNN